MATKAYLRAVEKAERKIAGLPEIEPLKATKPAIKRQPKTIADGKRKPGRPRKVRFEDTPEYWGEQLKREARREKSILTPLGGDCPVVEQATDERLRVVVDKLRKRRVREKHFLGPTARDSSAESEDRLHYIEDPTARMGELREDELRYIEACESSPISPELREWLDRASALGDISRYFGGLSDSNLQEAKSALEEQARGSTAEGQPPPQQIAALMLWHAFCAAGRLQPLAQLLPGHSPGEKLLGVLTLDGSIHQWVTIPGPGHHDRKTVIWAASQTQNTVFKSPWENEIIGYDVVAGCVYRLCHTRNSGLSQPSKISVSQSGRFITFTSDMMGTLGTTDGKEPILGQNCRSDLFGVEVKF
jgi:hypothetical protein